MGERAVGSTGRQSVRQAARRAVLDSQSARRRDREERELRVEALVVEVLVAVRERDAAIGSAEARADDALDRMVQRERLTVREVVDWCADGALISREAARLRAVAAAADGRTDPRGSDPLQATDAPSRKPSSPAAG